MRKRLGIAAGTASFVVASMIALAPQAWAANGGSVTCQNSTDVVGVWVNVQGGVSGWAKRSGDGYQQFWVYNTQGRPYSLNVGCGGTPQSWAETVSTPSYKTTWTDVLCWPRYGSYGEGTKFVKGRCT